MGYVSKKYEFERLNTDEVTYIFFDLFIAAFPVKLDPVIDKLTSLAIIPHEVAELLKKFESFTLTVDLIEWNTLASNAAVLFENVELFISTVDCSILATPEFF